MEERVKKTALIGTNPLSLLKAYLIGAKHPEYEVQMPDGYNDVGGDRRTEVLSKERENECSCPTSTYAPEVHNFIENELKIRLKQAVSFIGKKLSSSIR